MSKVIRVSEQTKDRLKKIAKKPDEAVSILLDAYDEWSRAQLLEALLKGEENAD